MKTVKLNNNIDSDDWDNILIEVCRILNEDSEDYQDFQVEQEGYHIIEYDNEEGDSIEWTIDTVGQNPDGTASHVNLFC